MRNHAFTFVDVRSACSAANLQQLCHESVIFIWCVKIVFAHRVNGAWHNILRFSMIGSGGHGIWPVMDLLGFRARLAGGDVPESVSIHDSLDGGDCLLD